MMRPTHLLAIVALSTLVSCTGQFTPASPPVESVTLRIGSTDSTMPLATTISTAYSEAHPDVVYETPSGNHARMLNMLLNGEIPYFISNHLPGDDSQALWAAPIAQDGLVVIVNHENPVTNLTTEQIRRIYRGFLINWQDVGGNGSAITVFSREAGSGTRAEFERLVMGQQRMSPNALVVPSPGAMLASVAEQPAAIGYLPLSLANEEVRIVAVDGVEPSLATVRDNSYPLRSTLFIVGLAEPHGDYRALVAWTQGMVGQAAIGTLYAPLPE